jgi:hypothetical protein
VHPSGHVQLVAFLQIHFSTLSGARGHDGQGYVSPAMM